jgi:hypothetical protein
LKTIVGVFGVAAVATVGDAIWYTYGVPHTIVAGLVHGAVLLTAVGARFTDLKPAEWTPGMRAIREKEVQHGLKVEARVFMRRCMGRRAALGGVSLVQS